MDKKQLASSEFAPMHEASDQKCDSLTLLKAQPITQLVLKRRPARRRGQALLLAVLLMVFAALLGSTFITVVALNLSQTSRGESKQDAQNSALAGLRDTNTRLQQSEQGEKWRPEQVNTPPFCGGGGQPADADCDTYYSPFEKAQGWARNVPTASTADGTPPGAAVAGDWDNNGTFEDQKDDWAKLEYFKQTYGNRVFVKFPDPRLLSATRSNTPTYLVEVKPLTAAEDPDRAGELRIDVIGRSTNSETAFARTTTIKGTSLSGGPNAVSHYVANYDTQHKRALETQLVLADMANATDPSIVVKDARGIEPGMRLLLQKGTGFRDALVRTVEAGTAPDTYTIHFRVPVASSLEVTDSNTAYTSGYNLGSKVRVASTLMDGITGTLGLDDDGDPATPNDTAIVPPVRSATDPLKKQSVGVHVNGALVAKENSIVGLSLARKDYLDVSGPIVTGTGAQAQLLSADTAGATAVALPDYSTSTGNYASNDVRSLVRATNGNGDPTSRADVVRSIAPPTLEGSDSRYLYLTKLADTDNGSEYGYGPGVFIDNREDIEKVGVVVPTTTPATDPAYRPLNVSDMQRFWQRKSFVAKETPGATATSPDQAPGTTPYKDDLAPTTAPNASLRGQVDAVHYRHDLSFQTGAGQGSLEQRHIRGWVSPNEFLPRGVLIELANDKIIVTRDDRSDASSTAPDNGKAWKDPKGNDKNSDPASPMSPRVYRMVLDLATGDRDFAVPTEPPTAATTGTKFNGVIYAEGNVRVRGTLGNTGHDITVVSMGNIYIEGSIERTGKDRIALLAKKNVVLNPTQITPRLAGSQDRFARAYADGARVVAGANTAQTFQVNLPKAFRVGDRIRVGADTTWKTIDSIDDAASTLTLTSAPAATPADNDPVRVLGDPDLVQDVTSPERYYYDLSNGVGLFTRNVQLGTATEAHYLWLLHAGGRSNSTFFNLTKSDTSGTDPRQVMLKPDDGFNAGIARDNRITAGEKRMFLTPVSGGNNFGPSGTNFIDLLDAATYPSIGSTGFRNAIEQPKPGGGKRWTMTASGSLPADVANAAPWRLANLFRAIYNAPGDTHPVPLTTSAIAFWSVGFDNLGGPNPFSAIIGTHPTDPTDVAGVERLDTSSELFYQRRDAAGAFTNAPPTWTNYQLANAAGRFTGAINSYAVSGGQLAGYHLAGFRVDRDDYTAAGAFKSSVDVTVDASIFAQDGSWFVIPMPVVNSLDTDNDGVVTDTEYENSLSATELLRVVDTNNDGLIDDTEYQNRMPLIRPFAQTKASHFRRPGYTFTIIGNIAENVSPTADLDYDDEKDPDGKAAGAMRTWIDSLSSPMNKVADASGTGFKGTDWQSIAYQASPLSSDPQVSNNNLYMPVSPDLVYGG